MPSIGFNLCGHDSSIFYINSQEKQIFGLDTERVTRKKHDRLLQIQPINSLYKLYNITDPLVFAKSHIRTIYFVYYPPEIYDPQFRDIVSENVPRIEKIKNILKYNPFHLPLIAVHHLLSEKVRVDLSLKYPCYGFSLFKKQITKKCGITMRDMVEYDHHTCHAASSYYLSPFSEGLSITVDGMGDNYISKVFRCKNNSMDFLYGSAGNSELKQNKFDFSFGRMYSNATETLGLIPESDEGKVEALAAYGDHNNKMFDFLMKNTIIIDNGDVRIEGTDELMKFFFEKKNLVNSMNSLGKENFAAAFQKWLELKVVEYIEKILLNEGKSNCCFSGGVFANVKLNQKIFEELGITNMYITPAMGDNGSTVGAAALNELSEGNDITWLKQCIMPYWGPSFSEKQVVDDIQKMKEKYQITSENLGKNWPEIAADLVGKGKIIAIFHGRMEYGPRALGNRSVLANPCLDSIREVLNTKIKKRAWYQPFCPSILEEERDRLFEKSYKNKHMTCAFTMKEKFRKELPGIIHIDGTSRPQFIEKSDNPPYYQLIHALKQETGFGVVLDTSFNLHGRAMVMTPIDAITDFIDCALDHVIIEGHLISRK